MWLNKLIRLYLARWRGHTALRLNDASIAPVFKTGNRLEAEKIALLDYEKDLLERFLKQIKPGDAILDAGANIGLYTLPSALKTGAAGRVHAFEPVPSWFLRLRENLEMNGVANVALHPVGLSDQSGSCSFTLKNVLGSGMGSMMAGYGDHVAEERQETIRVQLEKGDDYLAAQNAPPPNIIKIDVEGAELLVMKGLENTLRHPACRFVMCEVHPQYLNTRVDEVEKTLVSFGFTCSCTEPRGQEFHIFAIKNPPTR